MISNYFGLSESLAGATILAFSNGATDLITIASLAFHGQGEAEKLGIGGLFGASLFSLTIGLFVIVQSSASFTIDVDLYLVLDEEQGVYN